MKLQHILLAALCGAGLTAQAQGKMFTRNRVLVEKYTGINCQWCPSGDRAVEGFLNRHPEHRETMVEMRHNSYSSPDNLTISGFHSAIDAVWKPNGYPKYYVDRCSTLGNRHNFPGDYSVDWGQWNDVDFDPIAYRMGIPTHVSLDLEGSSFNPDTRELTIYAHGEVTADLPDLCINVFLVQDLMGYENTSRASMTLDLNGDPLRVYDGRYKVAFTTVLDPKYGQFPAVPSAMKAIAFVSSRFTTDIHGVRDFSNSEVHNAEIVSLTSLPTVSDMPATCSAPTVQVGDGKVFFTCDTPDAYYDFSVEADEMTTTSTTVALTGEDSPTFVIKASAATSELFPSEEVSYRFSLKDLLGPAPIVNGLLEREPAPTASTTVYTLSGQPVPDADSRNLLPGLYIVGGKKVIRK